MSDDAEQVKDEFRWTGDEAGLRKMLADNAYDPEKIEAFVTAFNDLLSRSPGDGCDIQCYSESKSCKTPAGKSGTKTREKCLNHATGVVYYSEWSDCA